MTMEITLIGDFFRNNPTQETTDFLVVPKGSSCHNVYEDYIGKKTVIDIKIMINKTGLPWIVGWS